MRLVDANVILRLILEDDRKKADDCERLLQRAVDGKEKLFISDFVIAEIVWVLERTYRLARKDIRPKIEGICNTPNLVFQNKHILQEAISIYEEANIDFIDAFHSAWIKHNGMEGVFSYDEHFDKVPGIGRKEP
ncbi:hypothetical protein AUJ67_00330 [Candidatus Desantisbacteria bacterium CG1_02_49_89]|nr:MAG: hypothetical protein AUJ67_00330 [Candidatus Desantisbacteria bacterium CG1_02_49_89]